MMTDPAIRILLVEDNDDHALLIKALLTEWSTPARINEIEHVLSFDAAMTRLDKARYDICLLDYKLGAVDGLILLRKMRERKIDTPVIFLTSMGDETVAVEAMKSGATDYISKEKLSGDLLAASIRYALDVHREELLRMEAEEALKKAKDELEIRVEERTTELRTANEALQEADRLKNQMIQNVSHEFRTPLGYVIGYVELLLEDDPDMGVLSEDQRRSLEIVAYQAHKLTRLVNNFVSIQMLETIPLTREPITVDQILFEAVESAKLDATDKNIELALDIDENLPEVEIDRLAMSQVLDNLLANAFKFTDEGGKVTIRSWQADGDGKVLVSVSDTGIGIPQGMLHSIFERFVQVDGTATRHYGGVGLGLAVCKEIVDAHDEKIWVESEVGKGTTFVFTMSPPH